MADRRALPSAKFRKIGVVRPGRIGQGDGEMTVEPRIPWFGEASPRRRWLVGVSGGADSTALLRLLVTHGFRKLVVCHLDHRLRGREATMDARFVERLAMEFGLPFETKRVAVARIARERGESVETAARGERHAFFAECARRHRCPRVILAHHADDQAETVLWNLLRGSHGLKGMRPVQRLAVAGGGELEIHRPLLAVRGRELRAWLTERGWPWREDASNGEPVATRNRLRLEALPLLDEIAGREVSVLLARAAAADEDAREIGEWALERARVTDPQGRLHVPVLRDLPPALQRAAVRHHLREHGIGEVDRRLLDRALELFGPAGPARVNLPGGGWLRRRAGRLFVEFPG